jgi:hypothetical protein
VDLTSAITTNFTGCASTSTTENRLSNHLEGVAGGIPREGFGTPPSTPRQSLEEKAWPVHVSGMASATQDPESGRSSVVKNKLWTEEVIFPPHFGLIDIWDR